MHGDYHDFLYVLLFHLDVGNAHIENEEHFSCDSDTEAKTCAMNILADNGIDENSGALYKGGVRIPLP